MTKARKVGDWKKLADARAKVEKVEYHGAGLSNVPNVRDVGSAAYRRLMAKRTAA